jgi:hypothetical protein
MELEKAIVLEDKFAKGEAAMRKHKWAAALSHFESILRDDPKSVDALN